MASNIIMGCAIWFAAGSTLVRLIQRRPDVVDLGVIIAFAALMFRDYIS